MLQEGEKSEKQFCTQRVARQMGKFVALVGLKIASLAFSVFFNIQILTTREAVFLCVEDNANLKIISPVSVKTKTPWKVPTCILVPVSHSIFSLSSLDLSYQNILPQSFQNMDAFSSSLFVNLNSLFIFQLYFMRNSLFLNNFRIYL